MCCAAYMTHRRQEDIQISPLFHFIAFFFFLKRRKYEPPLSNMSAASSYQEKENNNENKQINNNNIFIRENGLTLNSLYSNFIASLIRALVSTIQNFMSSEAHITSQNIIQIAGSMVLSIGCRIFAKPNIAIDKNASWIDKFFHDGSIHYVSVLYSFVVLQILLYTTSPSAINKVKTGRNRNFWSSLLLSIVLGCFDTRWRYSTEHLNRYNKNFERGKKHNIVDTATTSSFSGLDQESKLTLQNIKNRESSLSIVDEVDSDAERESPKSNGYDSNRRNLNNVSHASSMSPLRLRGSTVENSNNNNNNNTMSLPPRTPERNNFNNNHNNNSTNTTPKKTPNKSPYRRTPSKRRNNYKNYHKHHSPLLKAAARAVDRAVVKRKSTIKATTLNQED